MKSSPSPEDAAPTFATARNIRQKARTAGMHPDHWYAVEYDRAVPPGRVVEVEFWGKSIALYRGTDGQLRALENRCAHRQLKLSLGEVTDCTLTCAYHGWSYDEDGRVPTFRTSCSGGSSPRFGSAPIRCRSRYGLIWLFPGDPALAATTPIPEIPELEGPDAWACVPVDFTWRAHHSMIIDNVSDFTHAYLHRKYRPFVDRQADAMRDGRATGAARVRHPGRHGDGSPGCSSTAGAYRHERAWSSRYEYPYQWSNTDGTDQALVLRAADRRAHHARVLPLLFRVAEDPVHAAAHPARLMIAGPAPPTGC